MVDSSDVLEHWSNLNIYSETRRQEISNTLNPLVTSIEDYEKLACRLVMALGRIAPQDSRDDSLRDLFGEAFDALYASKNLFLDWLTTPAYSMLRRAYEISSLFAYLILEPNAFIDWESGKQISNAEIRSFLSEHPMGEREDELREMYRFLSQRTHVNRELTPHRQLGRGNEFTLGSISPPIFSIAGQALIWLLNIWFWVMALTMFHYKELLQVPDPDFGNAYLSVANDAQEVVKSVVADWEVLLKANGLHADEDAGT